MSAPITKRVFRTKEACEYLGISRRTLYRLVERKEIQQSRLVSARGYRSQPRYTREALDALISSGYKAGLR